MGAALPVHTKEWAMNSSRPTLDQVAAEAGVSRATASRAINGGSKVSPTAQAQVNEAIARLGYIPNRAARSLVTNRTDSIGLIIPEPDERVLTDPFFASVIRGLNIALKGTDIQLVLLIVQPGDPVSRIARYLNNGHLDGAVVVSHHKGDEFEQVIVGSHTPCVMIGRPFDRAKELTFVDLDNRSGGRIATEHLIAQGRTRIAHLAGPEDMAAGIDRKLGWHDALASGGLEPGPVTVGEFTTAAGIAGMKQILAEDPNIDAVFAGSDLMAVGALQVLRELGLRVPQDIAVVGFDNLGVSEVANPPLTSITNPVIEMAQWAAYELLHGIGHLTEQQLPVGLHAKVVARESGGIILPPVLVERSSSQ